MLDSTQIDRCLHIRKRAADRGDAGLAREVDAYLRRHGWRPDATPAETSQVEQRLEEQAKPRRGRPPTRRA